MWRPLGTLGTLGRLVAVTRSAFITVSVPTYGLCSVMLAHDPFLGQLGSFRCRGLGMSHRIGQGIEGITGFHRVSSVFGGRTAETAFFGKSIAFFGKIMAIFGNIFVIFKSFLAI